MHVVDADGANDDTGHDTADRPGNGSDTPTDVNVTFPVFVTKNEYATTSPADETVAGNADFAIVIVGPEAAGTVAEPVSVTGGPLGGVPETVAVFTIAPASMSACVTV